MPTKISLSISNFLVEEIENERELIDSQNNRSEFYEMLLQKGIIAYKDGKE